MNDLPNLNDLHGKFELVYTYEDSNGFLQTKRNQVSGESPNFILDEFGGGGYHEMTLQYTRMKTEGTPVIIAGKELIDVDLRFIFAPGPDKSADFSNNPTEIFESTDDGRFTGKVKLSEQKGNGNRWFLSSQSDKMQGDYGLYHGYEDHNAVRTYVLNNLENITLTVLDADPHSFTHYQPDWYLSERRLSKRITDRELKNIDGVSYIKWWAAKDKDFTQDVKHIANGKHCSIIPTTSMYDSYNSVFYVKAEFNETSKIVVKFVIRQTADKIDEIIDNSNQNLGVVKAYPLNDNQFEVLKSLQGDLIPASYTKEDYKILAIQDILSTYTYGAVDFVSNHNTPKAPRYKVDGVEVGEHKRFSPQNNFDARFDWKIRSNAGVTLDKNNYLFYLFKNEEDPTLENWFPKNWIRHLDGKPQSPEIPTFSTKSYIKAFNETSDPDIEGLNNSSGSLYEPWQVRLPWIAQTGVHGYKTRWNIKTVFDINKIFDASEIGKAYRKSGHTAHDYHMAVNGTDGSKIIPGFDGNAREKQEFFQHLKAGRMVILRLKQFSSAPSNIQATVTNNVEGTALGTEVYNGDVDLSSEGYQSKKALNTNKIALENSFNVYPNPSKRGVFNVHISTTENSLVSLELLDVLGRRVYKNKLSKEKGSRIIKIGEGLHLKKGVYILKVNSNGNTTNKKLIIE